MPKPWRENYQAFPRAVREHILRRAGGRCQVQGPTCTGTASVADHVVPDFEGGANTADNGQAACDPCHDAKTARERARAKAKRSRWRPAAQHPSANYRTSE